MPQGSYARFGKRALDLTLGSLLALVALAPIAVLSLGSMIAFRAPPIFVQPRIGLGGRPFRFIKLRSMATSVGTVTEKRALADVAIPRWGRFLRGTHLDELPQLLLVPLGRMSLVGPRPEMTALADRYPHEFAATRTMVRPGCTGLWQISVASNGMIYENPEYDERYVAGLSCRLDLWLLARTVPAMFGRRLETLEDAPGWALPQLPCPDGIGVEAAG